MSSPDSLRRSLTAVSLRAATMLALLSQIDQPDEVEEALREVLPDLIETFGLAAGALAADWYDETRAELGVSGRFRADPVPIGDRGAAALAAWASHRNIAESNWLVLAQGGLQRRVANVGRETVMQATVADPQATGWQRIARTGGCDFCQTLAGRGGVYSDSSARFASHDHCGCTAVPAWNGQPRAVMPYTPTKRNDADAERAEHWVAEHGYADAKR